MVRDTRGGLTELRFGSAEVLNRNLIEDLNQPFPHRPDIALPQIDILDLSVWKDVIAAKLRSPVGHPGPVRGARVVDVLYQRGDSCRVRLRLVWRVGGTEFGTEMTEHIQDVAYRRRLDTPLTGLSCNPRPGSYAWRQASITHRPSAAQWAAPAMPEPSMRASKAGAERASGALSRDVAAHPNRGCRRGPRHGQRISASALGGTIRCR